MVFVLLVLVFIIQIKASKYSTTYMEGEQYLAFAEVMPEPVDGLIGIIKLIKYPEMARKAGIEGKVYVLAFINETGGVDDVKLIKGIGGGCDDAAVDAVKRTKFSIGENMGKAVKVKVSLQLQFKIH